MCLVASQTAFAEAPKSKMLDKFDHIDPKTLLGREVKMKVITTPDAEHHKALEVVADFAKANAWSCLQKKFAAGTISLKKYSGVRFWAKSNSETSMTIFLGGDKARSPEKRDAFGNGQVKATDTWTQYSFPFDQMKRHGDKFWKDGKQVILEGGDPMDEVDAGNFTRIEFYFPINGRGTAVSSHMVIDGLELMEK